ncbi:MAG: GspH/FimT family pseudopilin [Pseudomonadota bacterium]
MTQQKANGFTLLELIIAIALVALLTAIAVPSFRAVIQNNRITAQTNDLLTAFQLARSEAVRRGRPVTICAADVVGGGNAPTCGTNWNLGWMAVVDGVASAGSSNVAVDERLRVWYPSSEEAQITAPADLEFVRYLPRGEIDANAGAVLPAVIGLRLDDCTRDEARQIELTRSGKASAERVVCS